jgi:pyridoxine 5-phosphate synthase
LHIIENKCYAFQIIVNNFLSPQLFNLQPSTFNLQSSILYLLPSLLVNIDHIATLRNARGEGVPDPAVAAQVCEANGAAGIVFHLREDRRHIKDADVWQLKKVVKGILDFEMAATDEMIGISLEVQPHLVTLVPEKRMELTTEGGLGLSIASEDLRKRVIPQYKGTGITISLFVNPDIIDMERSADLGVEAIELHTGTYAHAFRDGDYRFELDRLVNAAERAHELGLLVNAGHGLSMQNLPPFLEAVPHLNDISIGHALVCDALFEGLPAMVRRMSELISGSN